MSEPAIFFVRSWEGPSVLVLHQEHGLYRTASLRGGGKAEWMEHAAGLDGIPVRVVHGSPEEVCEEAWLLREDESARLFPGAIERLPLSISGASVLLRKGQVEVRARGAFRFPLADPQKGELAGMVILSGPDSPHALFGLYKNESRKRAYWKCVVPAGETEWISVGIPGASINRIEAAFDGAFFLTIQDCRKPLRAQVSLVEVAAEGLRTLGTVETGAEAPPQAFPMPERASGAPEAGKVGLLLFQRMGERRVRLTMQIRDAIADRTVWEADLGIWDVWKPDQLVARISPDRRTAVLHVSPWETVMLRLPDPESAAGR